MSTTPTAPAAPSLVEKIRAQTVDVNKVRLCAMLCLPGPSYEAGFQEGLEAAANVAEQHEAAAVPPSVEQMVRELLEQALHDGIISYDSAEPFTSGELVGVANLLAGMLRHAAVPASFQSRVCPWMIACFGEKISRDRQERCHRFLEESLELVQSVGCTASEAHQLVDYVFTRPAGDVKQEAGGVMVTLAALCLAVGQDMHDAGEVELARIWTKVEAIRAKQAAKPQHSPLPQAAAVPAEGEDVWENVPVPPGKRVGTFHCTFRPAEKEGRQSDPLAPLKGVAFTFDPARCNHLGKPPEECESINCLRAQLSAARAELAAVRQRVLDRINESPVHARDDHSQNCFLCGLLKFIDAAKAGEVKPQSPWRDVREHPIPDTDDCTLLLVKLKPSTEQSQGFEYYGDPVVVRHRGHKLKTTVHPLRLERDDVTHWMPLPEGVTP